MKIIEELLEHKYENKPTYWIFGVSLKGEAEGGNTEYQALEPSHFLLNCHDIFEHQKKI